VISGDLNLVIKKKME